MFCPTPPEVVADGCARDLSARCRLVAPLIVTALACLVFTGTVLSLDAGPLAWGSRAFHENSDSRGIPWGPEFRMTLGVFAAGFEPTPGNTAQWPAHWHELGTAEFDPAERRFAGMIETPAPLPEGVAPQVHIWARNHDNPVPGTEWLLFTRPDWQWPVATTNHLARPVITWVADGHSAAVVGSVGLDGAALATAAVGPAPEALDDWLAYWFPDGGPASLPDADPDGDGMSNRLEYYLGGDPTRAGRPVVPAISPVDGGLRLSLPRNPAVPSHFAVETSADLATWHPAGHSVVQDRPDFIEVEVPATDGRAFFRIQLSSPPAP
jgi:hypothetical protein